jgi:hypothetical protein
MTPTSVTNGRTTAMPTPEVRAGRYDVSCLPPDDESAALFTLRVEYRGRGLWAVMDGAFALDADGNGDFEPSASNRDGDWLAKYRFPLDKALEIAKRAAPLMTVNRWTVSDALAARAARLAKGESR